MSCWTAAADSASYRQMTRRPSSRRPGFTGALVHRFAQCRRRDS